MTKPLSKTRLNMFIDAWRFICSHTPTSEACFKCLRRKECRLALRQIREMIEEGR